MRVSAQRLDEILDQLKSGEPATKATREEWASIAAELRQLRLRTSSESRSEFAAHDLR